MKVLIVTVLSLCIAVSASANYKVATISLEALAKQSDAIVIAEVTEIVTRAGVRVAIAKVLESVRPGSPTGKIEFIAEPTWTCDISSAVVGERVLLYLDKVRKGARVTMLKQDLAKAASKSRNAGRTLYALGHSGRGRLVLTKSREDWIIRISRWQDGNVWNLNISLMLPSEVEVRVDGPLKGRVALSDIVASTKTALQPKRGES